MIHADSEANARVKAALKGIVVTSVEADALDHLAAAGHRRGSTQRPPIKRWALLITGAAAAAVTFAIFVGLVATLVGDGAKPSERLAESVPAQEERILVDDGAKPSDRMAESAPAQEAQPGRTKPSATPIRSVDPLQLSADQVFAQSSPAVVRVLVKDGEMQTTGQGWGFSYRQMVCSSPTSM